MQGFQFGHIETWSRSGVSKRNGTTSKVRRNGQRGWTPAQIIDEAAREPGAADHVGLERRDPVVIAGTCASFDELRDAHDEACNVKVSVPYTNPKTKKKGTRKRAVRVDTHTLYTAVVSLPVESAEALRDSKKMAECRGAFNMVIGFEKRRLEDAGGEFAMAVIHLDERQVHLHIYGLDRQRGSVNGLHPGKAAQDAFRSRHGALSKSGTNLYERSKRAYCDAMREWQDDLHRDALGKAGLCRFGPRRSRYSRGQWSERKREEEERAQGQETIETASKMTRHLKAASEAVAAGEKTIFEERDALQVERKDLKKQRGHLDRKEQQLDAGLATVEAMAEGLLEHQEKDGEHTIRQSMTSRKHVLWPKLAERMRRAPQEALRIGVLLSATFEKARKRAAEEGREEARDAARRDLAEQFSGLGAVHTFARKLIGRLRTSKERQEATEELRKASLRASASKAKLDRSEGGERRGTDDDPQGL